MTIGAGHIVRVTARMRILGAIALENVYLVRSNSTGVSSDEDAMTDFAAWLDDAYTEIVPFMSEAVLFVDVRGFNESSDEPLPSAPWPALSAGAGGTDILATGVAAIALFHTAKARVIGRKFLGGFMENAITSALWAASALGGLVAYALIIAAGPGNANSGGDFDFVIRDKVGVTRTVARTVINAIPGYQRRRRSGVGV